MLNPLIISQTKQRERQSKKLKKDTSTELQQSDVTGQVLTMVTVQGDTHLDKHGMGGRRGDGEDRQTNRQGSLITKCI